MLLFSFPGEAYDALVSFLDENEPSWRSSLRGDMVKAVRGDGKVCVRETKEGFCPTVPGTACVGFCFGIERVLPTDSHGPAEMRERACVSRRTEFSPSLYVQESSPLSPIG